MKNERNAATEEQNGSDRRASHRVSATHLRRPPANSSVCNKPLAKTGNAFPESAAASLMRRPAASAQNRREDLPVDIAAAEDHRNAAAAHRLALLKEGG